MHGLLRSKDRDAGNHVCAKPQGSTGRPGCDINCCAPLGPSAGELMKPTQPVQTLQASSPSRPPRQAFSAPWNKPTAPRPPSPLFTLLLIGSSFALGVILVRTCSVSVWCCVGLVLCWFWRCFDLVLCWFGTVLVWYCAGFGVGLFWCYVGLVLFWFGVVLDWYCLGLVVCWFGTVWVWRCCAGLVLVWFAVGLVLVLF